MGLIFIDFPALFLSSTLTCERYLPSVYVESAYSYPAQIQSACNVPELQTIGENKKIQKEKQTKVTLLQALLSGVREAINPSPPSRNTSTYTQHVHPSTYDVSKS